MRIFESVIYTICESNKTVQDYVQRNYFNRKGRNNNYNHRYSTRNDVTE